MRNTAKRSMLGAALAVCATLALGVAAFTIHEAIAASRAGHVLERLSATSAQPEARGAARLALRSSKKGRFLVTARRLDATKSYDVIVGGVKVGDVQANRRGAARVRFSTQPRAREELLGFDPQGQELVVRDEETGEDVLVGDIEDVDPSAVACCITTSESGEADDEGEAEDEVESECEDLTPEACAAANGVVQQVSSCLPDPCSTTPEEEGHEIVCCLNESHDEGTEAHCEDVQTSAACSAAGGTVIDAVSCDGNPCDATPPANRVACCVPESEGEAGDDDGGEGAGVDCKVVTAESCAALGGSEAGGTSCESNPCGG